MLGKILSFDPARVKFITSSNGRITKVTKLTSIQEYQQMVQAMQHLKAFPLIIGPGLIVEPALTLNWDMQKGELTTEYFEGINLELALRNWQSVDRQELLQLVTDLFQGMERSGFLWGDFAPRNIIVNNELSRVCLVDFERNSAFLQDSADHEFYCRHIGSYAREEFSSFLFQSEQEQLFSAYQEKGKNRRVKVSSIESNRKRKLLSIHFGEKSEYCLHEIQKVEDLMAFVATPFLVDGEVVFPMDRLDQVASDNGQGAYVKLAIQLRGLDEHERYEKLREER